MRLANFPLVVSILLLLAAPVYSAQLINVTGDGVELTYVYVDCNGENEIGITVAGASFVGKNISVQNCAGGAYAINETATLTNSIGISAGADVTIAADKTLTGTYNLFGDAAKAGDGTYSDGSSTSLWSAAYTDRIDAGAAIESLHTGKTIVGGDAAGVLYLFGAGIDIGAYERPKFIDGIPGKMWDATPKYYTVP